jgi:glutamate-1-semialdehyde 2,1-aminomutase
MFYARAEGSRLWDVDGNEFTDFALSQGPMILGHSHPFVLEAVSRAMLSGQLYGGQHVEEVELAEKLTRLVPCAERVRFNLSASEAVQAVLRLARAYTQKPKIVKFEGHYHGWLDSVAFSINPPVSAAGPAKAPHAVPWCDGIAAGSESNLIILPWNDLDAISTVFEQKAGEIAAVICEPVMCNNGCIPPEPGFLPGLQQLCQRHGAPLILDETITGFRLALGGAQEYLGVTPDLAVFGKALANGFPISAIAGRAPIMSLLSDGRCLHAGTLNAQNTVVAAALATLQFLENDASRIYARLFKMGQDLRAELGAAAARYGHEILTQGIGPVFHMGFTPAKKVIDYRGTLAYDQPKYHAFCDGMRERGFRLIGRGLWYISTAHTEEDIEKCVLGAGQTLAEMRAS